MYLTDEEKRMLNGENGIIVQKSMELMVKYGEALGADRLLPVDKVYGGTVGCSNTDLAMKMLDEVKSFDRLYLRQALCTDLKDESLPKFKCFTCDLAENLDMDCWQSLEVPKERYDFAVNSFNYARSIDFNYIATCAPYEIGIWPLFGEHVASMESSNVVLFNSILGARTNTEGIESSTAAAYTGRIPNWGLHLDENRRGTHLIDVTIPVETCRDWGLLGFYFGEKVQEKIPVINGIQKRPLSYMVKHCGAAAASSGGVEMYHIVGITPEARDLHDAFKGNPIRETFVYGENERRQAYEKLNTGKGEDIDHIILGCPHYSYQQIYMLLKALAGRKVKDGVRVWMMTSYSSLAMARRQGFAKELEEAGILLVHDACPALSSLKLHDARCVATDSAKMAKYYPDMAKLPVYFGSMEECVEAAVSGKWHGHL